MSATIDTLEQLQALYGVPHERSLRKELTYLSAPYQALVAASPFVVLATHGPDGLDCSPRGDAPGFVRILDEHTLLLPCLLYTSPSPRDVEESRMPSSA